ncbi:hypothetical protein TSMEX_003221 [Taenia solium]|eukprot:TsM_000224300 transcript=TsM_000224300 gene=TsM_000224300
MWLPQPEQTKYYKFFLQLLWQNIAACKRGALFRIGRFRGMLGVVFEAKPSIAFRMEEYFNTFLLIAAWESTKAK